MSNNEKLPMGISIATLASAFIAVGVLWTKVDVLADDQVTEVRVVKIENAVDNIEEDVAEIVITLDKHIEEQSQKQDQQMSMLEAILKEIGDD